MVEVLLRRGAKPNLPDDPPWATPLAWAMRRGHQEVADLLDQCAATGTLPGRSLGHYERLARDLVEACTSGGPGALQRINDYFQPHRRPNADQLRAEVWERLGRRPDPENGSDRLALADAQLLVARSHGFESWAQLVRHSENPVAATRTDKKGNP